MNPKPRGYKNFKILITSNKTGFCFLGLASKPRFKFSLKYNIDNGRELKLVTCSVLQY